MHINLKFNIMSIFKRNKEEEKDKSESNHPEETKYQCPMKCEGDKMYDQPGRCPVCKMYLVPVK